MVDWASIGGGIGSVINAVAPLLGGNGTSDAEAQKWMTKHRVEMTVRDAEKAGIHPLAALGAGWPNYQPVGGSNAGAKEVGGNLAAAAKFFGNALGGPQEENMKADTAKTLAETELIKAQAVTLNGQAGAVSKGATTGVTNLANPEDLSIMVPANSGNPETAGATLQSGGNMFNTTKTPDGRNVPQANPNTNVDPEVDLWTHARNGTIVNYAESLFKRNMSRETYGQLRNFLDKALRTPRGMALIEKQPTLLDDLRKLDKKLNQWLLELSPNWGKSANERFMK